MKININGILLLDKPIGLSSNAALQKVKRLFRAKKAGHTGSLDPLATGMLPICFGQSTKLAQGFLALDKIYVVTGQLGTKTTTGDVEGEVVETKAVPEQLSLEKTLDLFRGEITQIPPMYSALKHQGQPLYKLARQGITVEREPRSQTVYQLDLIEYNPENLTLKLKICCSKGTYVRTLIEDIAEALGTVGHVIELRRIQVGDFQEADMLTLETLETLTEEELLKTLRENERKDSPL